MNTASRINELFQTGEPITAKRLLEAYAAETALEKAWESKIKSEYQIEKLAYDQTNKTPAIDIPKVTPSKRAETRTEYLRNKYKIGEGFAYSCVSWNGGIRRYERLPEAKQAKESKVMRCYGNTYEVEF